MIYSIICAVIAVAVAAFAQILLKKSAIEQSAGGSNAGNSVKKSISASDYAGDVLGVSGKLCLFLLKYLNRKVVLAYSLMIASLAFNIYAYKRIELKYVQIFDVSSIIWVTILASMILGERPNRRRIVAIVLVVAGSIVFCL